MPDPSRFAIHAHMAKGDSPPVLAINDAIGREPEKSGIASNDVSVFLDRNRKAPVVEVHINSGGGLATEGIEIFNALRAFPGTVVTINKGWALSAACLVFAAGERRLMTVGSQLMVHEASLKGVSGNADQLRRAIEFLEALNRSAAELMASRAGRSTAHVLDLMKQETWFDSDKAISEGFATGRSSGQATMSASVNLSGYRNVPPAFSQFKSAVSATAEDRFSVIL